MESALSGVMTRLGQGDTMIYFRTFILPLTRGWADKRTRLVFEAVDYEAEIRVNGEVVGSHRGGYDRCFSVLCQCQYSYRFSTKSGSHLTSVTS